MAIKQSRGITIGKGTPQRNEGQNGDITVRSLRKGLKMYVKQANVWHSVDLDIDLKQIATTVNNLERKVKELSTRRNNFPVVDKVMLKQAGGAAAVQIKNDAGAIAFRNSADSADITLKNPKIAGALDGSDANPVIDTQTSNSVKAVFNDIDDHFGLRLLHGSASAHRNALSFYTGATHHWSIGHLCNDNDTLRITGHPDLSTNVELTLTDSGNLTTAGTVTSSAGVCGGTTAASTTASGIVELATTAETTTGTDTARAVTPDGLKDGFEGSTNIGVLGEVETGTWLADAIAEDYIGNLPTSKITSGTMADARIAASNVTQHEGSIDAVGALDGGSITSGFGAIDIGSSTLAAGEITSGAVIWQYFPFVTSSQTSARGHYFRDYDDLYSPHEKWDAFDTDMVLDYRGIYGFLCVPENCTLVAWHGKVANSVTTVNPTISVYHATPETDTSNTTFALAGSASVVSIGTARVAHDFSGTCDVDLSAGDLVVPTIKHSDLASQGYAGSITLKFITR